ncbi:MAG: DegT/DnrJ/EryC1/StrS family aminotransferase [Candidatus Thiodiazotropha sp.]
MPRFLSPTGSPIKSREMIGWISALLRGVDHSETIKQLIARDLNLAYGALYITGRAAMASLLGCLMRMRGEDDQRDEIILPAYTCYSVASSAINAGYKIRLCDIDPKTLSYDMASLNNMDTDRVLAMVSANLYGLPNDLPVLEQFAKANNIHLIDDAAQSLFARVGGRFVGTFGYAGVLSFDKGKNITSLQGGMVITGNEELQTQLLMAQSELSDLQATGQIKEFIKVFIYYLLLHPVMYQIPANISFSGLGETRYEDTVAVLKYPPMLSSLAKDQLLRADRITQSRVSTGRYYDQSIEQSVNLSKIEAVPGSEPVYLRYPILIRDVALRSHLLKEQRAMGISASYPKSLNQLSEIRQHLVGETSCPVAEQVAAQIVTLPTHAYVREQDQQSVVDIVNKYCNNQPLGKT